MEKIRVFVTGTGSLIGQAIIKSIRDSSISEYIEIVGGDYFQNTVGSFWCDKNYVLPDILKHNSEAEWTQKIFEIIEREKIRILFIGVDFELVRFCKLRDEIKNKTNCDVIVSDERVIEIADDKYLTAQFLQENLFNYPKTYLVDECENIDVKYPCVLKPRVGSRSKGVQIITRKSELIKIAKKTNNFIIQELIGTECSEYTCGVLYMNDRLIASIALNRTLKEGNTHLARYKKDFPSEIYDYIEKIAYKLKPFGSCNFQLRWGLDNKPYLFEINPRFSGTTYIRSLFGYREVEYIIKELLGLENKPFTLREGTVYRYYDERFVQK